MADADRTPQRTRYLYQYRNEVCPEWSQPWPFVRYDRPDMREPESLEEARASLQTIVANWVAGTEMRVLVVTSEPDGEVLRPQRNQEETKC